MRNLPLLALTALLFTSASFPASAQMGDSREVYEQMDKLERDVMMLQRQVARGGGGNVPISAGDMPEGAGAAQLEVRLSTIEDEMRRLRGKVEEYEFQIKRNNEAAAKFQRDTEFRLTDIEQRLANAARAPENPPATTPAPKPQDATRPTTAPAEVTDGQIDTSSEASIVVKEGDEERTNSAPNDGDGTLKQPKEEGDAPTSFDTPRDHYNYAFRLLNQTKYEQAATYFTSFTEKHKKDPLIGNAYYWLGETYYIRRDYVKAADNFREGFEALPNGPKGADNLLKLSMSLAAMKKTKDACVVLDQILARFKDSSQSTTKKAQSERTRIGCK